MDSLSITTGGTFGSTSASKTEAMTNEGVTAFEITVPPSTTNLLVTLAITVAQMSGLLISSNGNLTLKTNSSGSPAQTIALEGGEPLIWKSGWYYTSPLTTNVTALYVTNASSTDAVVLKFAVAVDATP